MSNDIFIRPTTAEDLDILLDEYWPTPCFFCEELILAEENDELVTVFTRDMFSSLRVRHVDEAPDLGQLAHEHCSQTLSKSYKLVGKW